MLETDAPYLAPVPFRGKRNESSYLLQVAIEMSKVYDIPITEVAEKTTSNAIELFRLNG
jgi:TatD DNase family protein